MEVLHIIDLKFLFIIIVQFIGFFTLFAKSYSGEKGKNLATKQDIGEITKQIEQVKSDLLYKSEHLIHLRAAERDAILNYYKSIWALVINIEKADLSKNEIDTLIEKDGKIPETQLPTPSQLIRYISEGESILNKIKEELSNLKYLHDISQSDLMFFCDETELVHTINRLKLSVSEFERNLISTVNSLLNVFKEITVRINDGQLLEKVVKEAKRERSAMLTKWFDEKDDSLSAIRLVNDELKKTLHNRLKSLTS